MPVLKVARDAENDEEELQFELDFLRSLSVAERYDLMFRRSREIAEQLIRHGHREPVALLKRT